MTKKEYFQITEALNELERCGFDVKALWREFSERNAAEQKLLNTPAPVATLNLSLEAYLAGSVRPSLLLCQRELALKSEIERLSLVFDRLEQKALSITLGRSERKHIESMMNATKHEFSTRRKALHDAEALKRNKRALAKLAKKVPNKTPEPMPLKRHGSS